MSTKAIQVNTGDRYNRWEVISEVFYKKFPGGSTAKFVKCRCECGTESTIRLAALTSPTKASISCGCYRIEQTKLKNTITLEVGSKIARLTVIENMGMLETESAPRNFIKVLCDCGNSEPFLVRLDGLNSGNTKSCGCLQVEVATENATTHGMTITTAYSSWQGMKDRCNNPNNSRWDRYGGRGIGYPSRWNTFESFWKEMWEGWYEGADIDRIDFDLSYSKENCRWVDRDVGNHNKSKPSNCTSEYKGVYYDKQRDKWTARLNRNGIIHLQQRFNTEHEAALAYDDASEEYYGDRPNKTIKELLVPI